jgi:GMP synthase (glutamine-hydrolysing) A subunit
MAANGEGPVGDITKRHSVCLVLDYGSQYTQLIARRVRENGVLSMLLPGDVTMVGARPRRAEPIRAAPRARARRPAAAGTAAAAAPPPPPPTALNQHFRALQIQFILTASAAAAHPTLPLPQERIEAAHPRVIILSGGPNSVHLEGAPRLPDGFLAYVEARKIPVLGICYGMQLLVHSLGGRVKTATGGGEYGRMPINVVRASTLFGGEAADSQSVWMSHGDEAEALPPGFGCVARSEQGAVVAVECPERSMFGLQYHPEVVHSERGAATIKRFLFDVAGLTGDWNMADVLAEESAKIAAAVGPTDHVICALSGGVDSTVAATLVHRVLGDRLHCVFVDNGLLRLDEAARVMETFNAHLHLPVTKIDTTERMLAELKGLTDPEAKRKAIGRHFIEVFSDYAAGLEGQLGHKPRFLVQVRGLPRAWFAASMLLQS